MSKIGALRFVLHKDDKLRRLSKWKLERRAIVVCFTPVRHLKITMNMMSIECFMGQEALMFAKA